MIEGDSGRATREGLRYVFQLDELDRSRGAEVGSKAAGLGDMIKVGLPVPPGFAIAGKAFDRFLEFNKITTGFVSQKFRKDSSGKFKCIWQEFVAGDDVQFENVLGENIEEPQHEYQPFNMSFLSTTQIVDRLGDVLTSIDVGGEQSRQFAHEIQILDTLLKDLGWSRDD